MRRLDPSSRALRRLVTQTVSQRMNHRRHGRYRLDVTIERSQRRGILEYETRVLVIDTRRSSLRHSVRAVARARISGRHAGRARLEDRVARAATERAVRDALELVGGRRALATVHRAQRRF